MSTTSSSFRGWLTPGWLSAAGIASPCACSGRGCCSSLLITLALLGAIYLVAWATVPTATRYLTPGYNDGAGFGDYLHVLFRNGLVLALHALACVAGFIAGSSLPLSASQRSGVSRWVDEKAGPLAIAFRGLRHLFLPLHPGLRDRRRDGVDRPTARHDPRRLTGCPHATRRARARRPVPAAGRVG